MAGHDKKTMEQILEKLNQVVEKNEEMESEMLRCQDEILALKKSKLDLKRHYDLTAKEVKTLKAKIDDMESLSPTPAGATDLTTKTKMSGHDEKTMEQILEKLNQVVEKNEEMAKKTEEIELAMAEKADEMEAMAEKTEEMELAMAEKTEKMEAMAKKTEEMELAMAKKTEEMELAMAKKTEEMEAMAKKTEEMESEMLRCQDELLALKKSKLDLKRHYEQTAKEVKTLKATIDDMESLSPTPAGATDLTTKTELSSVRNDIKNVQDDIEDMKTDVSRISVSVQETNRLSRGVGEQGRILNTLTDRFNTAVHKLDVTDRRVEKLQMVFNRTHASIQATKDLGEEVSNLKTETSTLKAKVNHQEQQQQQLQKQHQQLQLQQQQMQQPPQQSVSSPAPSPTPGAVAASLPVKKPSPTPGAVAASLPVKKLTPEELEKIQKDSEFHVGDPSIPGSLHTGQPTRLGGYRYVVTPSPYVNKDSGVYKTPVQGKYTFGGWMEQEGSGKMSLFVCGDREGRRELLGETDRHYGGWCGRDVSWECEEGECVWLEVVRTEGQAEVWYCVFNGQLME